MPNSLAMAGYLRANGLADKLIKKDWTALRRVTMARVTGKTAYDVKLAEQYQRFASGSLPNLEMRYCAESLCFSWATLREKSMASSARARARRSRTFGSPPVCSG